MKVGVAGTFSILHRGHRTLLDRAFQLGDWVVVGITSDSFPSKKRFHVPLEQRLEALEDYLFSLDKKWEIEILQDRMGSAAHDKELNLLVVSQGTVENAQRINEFRISKGLKPMVIEEIKHVLGEDCATITSTRVLEGEIDTDGRLLRPLRVNVGSDNPVKVEAVRRVMSELYREVEIASVCVKTTVGEQPWGENILTGARERARSAIGKADFGVGIEAGILELDDGLYGIQFCAIIDKGGIVTSGQSSGFRYPPEIEKRIRAGVAVSKAFDDFCGTKDIGHNEGAIGFLTKGILNRQQLSEQAVQAAMVPRIRPDIYLEV
ncbi:MAG: inosine/xanthosine triphosphatase [Methanomassiliicoccales archaeon]|jgi:inosine/xanthosine triphosphatase